MQISTALLILYVAIASVAFLITQIHLWRAAKKIMRGSKESWARAQQTIFEAEKVIHDDVLKQLAESPGLGDAKTQIAELGARVNALPVMLEDRFLKLQGGLRESFVSFGDSLDRTLKPITALLSSPKIAGNQFAGDPKGAQAAGVDSRKVNQIVSALELGVGTGGNLLGAVNEVAGMLQDFGQPELADWLQENPDKLPMVYARVQRIPRLAQGLAKLEQRLAGGAPGNGGGNPLNWKV